ncbi:MAG TPA: hypothetical protein VGE07_21405, partial [Herpetosiphonaceae bacterium]
LGGSKPFYDAQFKLIKELGVDGIVYEYYKEQGAGWPKLSPNFLQSLQEHQVKIGLFYDLEIQQVGAIGPVLSEEGYIKPSAEFSQSMVETMADFYERIPRELWLTDSQNRLPMMIFGFGFNLESKDEQAWHGFYESLLAGLEARLGLKPVIYWTAINKMQQVYAFQNFPEQIRPFNFVLDNPQPQLAPGAVTWNINFDNLGVLKAHNMQRVIRDDPRYLQEMLWLAKHTAPELVFIYSWNEFYEGANIMPDKTYGTSRYEFMQALLKDLRANRGPVLPCTLLIVDEYAEIWQSNDWHLHIEEQFTLYPLRRLAPQADVRLVGEVTPELLEQYDLIVYLANNQPEQLAAIAEVIDRKRVVVIGPRLGFMETLRGRFATQAAHLDRNRNVELRGPAGEDLGEIFIHDDAFNLTPATGVITAASIIDGGVATPLLLKQGDDWWMNAYAPDDRLLAPIFADVYGRPLEESIMYGEGRRSQRLEVAPDGAVTQNTFSAPAAYQHLPLPAPWSPPPPPEAPTR